MILKHYYLEKIAHSSYILAGNEICAVIDPRRDVDIYINEAEKMGLKITHILETHLHADFVSGHIELSEKTGAKIYMPESKFAKYDHVPLKKGDMFGIEDMKIEVIETPGHTPEHISYIVTDLARGTEPIGVFCGDTLFVGDVGRPDLFPNRAEELAKKLYDSLFNKLLKLPDYCEVYPAHGSGSLCGKAMAAKYTSTIGYEKKFNPILQNKNIKEFVYNLTNNMPGVPDHFARSSKTNALGPKCLNEFDNMRKLKPNEFKEICEDEKTVVMDVRSYESFGGMHIKGAYSNDLSGNIPTFAGWVIPPEKNVLIVADSFADAQEASIWLKRVGVDNVIGYLQGGMQAWTASGYPVSNVAQISASDLVDMMNTKDLLIIDGRGSTSFESGHIEGSVNILAPDLRFKEFDRDKNIAVLCNSGRQSSLGISILKQKGYEKVFNLAGGMKGYNNFIKNK